MSGGGQVERIVKNNLFTFLARAAMIVGGTIAPFALLLLQLIINSTADTQRLLSETTVQVRLLKQSVEYNLLTANTKISDHETRLRTIESSPRVMTPR